MAVDKNSYFAGKLLLAMPGMTDPRFHRAVILLCAHDEKGAMGLVINHVLAGIDFKNLLDQLNIISDIEINFAPTIPVMTGGPVEGSRGFILHPIEFRRKDTVPVGDIYGITGTIEALKEIAAGKGPDNMLFILGYAGWGPGQLDQEIQDNAWLVTEADPIILFHAAPEEKWGLGIQKLGFDPAMLSMQGGRA